MKYPTSGHGLIRKPRLRRVAHAPRVPFSAPSRKTLNAPESSGDPTQGLVPMYWTRGASSNTRGGCAPQPRFSGLRPYHGNPSESPGFTKTQGDAGRGIVPAEMACGDKLVAIPAPATAAAVIPTRPAVIARTVFFRAGDIDGDLTVAKGGSVQGLDRLLRLFRRGHGDEGEAAR